MKLHTVNAIHAFGLILISIYRYNNAHTPTNSNLVPIFFGVLLLVCNSGIEYNNKAMINMAIGLTVLGLLGLINQISRNIGIYNSTDTILVTVMITTSIISLGFFLKNAIRKK